MTGRTTVALFGAIAVLGTLPAAANSAPTARLTDFHVVPMIVPDPPMPLALGPSPDPSSATFDLDLPGRGQVLNAQGGAPASPGLVAPVGPSDPRPFPIRIGYTIEWITG